jgi:hypothetical protein
MYLYEKKNHITTICKIIPSMLKKKKRKYIIGMYQNRIKNNKKKLQTWMLNLSSKHKCNTLLSYSIQYENI